MFRNIPRPVVIVGLFTVLLNVLFYMPAWPAHGRPIASWPGETQNEKDPLQQERARGRFVNDGKLPYGLSDTGRVIRPLIAAQRIEQKRLAAARLNLIGGYPGLYKAARAFFDSAHHDIKTKGGGWMPGMPSAVMPRALATLQTRKIIIQRRDIGGADGVTIKLFGAIASGTRGIPFYGYCVVFDAASGYVPEAAGGERTTGVFHKVADNIYEVY